MEYIVELVTRDAPYISIGFVSIESARELKITRLECKALIIKNKMCLEHVLNLIKENNNDNSKLRIMDWITSTSNKNKRIFANEITF